MRTSPFVRNLLEPDEEYAHLAKSIAETQAEIRAAFRRTGKGRLKPRKRTCPACRSGGFLTIKAGDGRPLFVCTQCDHRWTCGADGGEYAT